MPDRCECRGCADATERRRLNEQKDIKAREAAAAQAQTKAAEAETVAAKAQADLTQLQAEKADLQTKLQANQAEVASLQRRIEEAGGKPADNPGAASAPEMQAQLDEARRQRRTRNANAFLSEKFEPRRKRPIG